MRNRKRNSMIGGFTTVEVLIMIVAVLLVVGGVAAAMSDNICDTPFGAKDYRCVGYYNHSNSQRGF